MPTDLDNAQSTALVTATSELLRIDSAQDTALVAATSELLRIDAAQCVALVIANYIPPRRKQSIVVVAN